MLTLRHALSRMRRMLVGASSRPSKALPRVRNFVDVAARTIQTDQLDRLMAGFGGALGPERADPHPLAVHERQVRVVVMYAASERSLRTRY